VIIAGGLGLLLAPAGISFLLSFVPAEEAPSLSIGVDRTVLLVSLAVIILTAIISGVLPAIKASRLDLSRILAAGGAITNDAGVSRRMRNAFLVLQLALALVPLVGAGLLIQSFIRLQRVDPGFNARNVLTFRLQTTSKYRALTDGLPYLEQVRDRVAALPGVVDVGLVAHLPMSGYAWTTNARRPDQVLAPGEQAPSVGWRFIHGNYFAVMHIPLKYGRQFTDADTVKSAAVAIVNETFARQFFVEASSAVGRTLIVRSGRTGKDETVEVVGVVGDVRHISLDTAPLPELFRPLAQTFMFPMAMVARTQGPPEQIAAAVRQIAFEVDPVVPVAELQPYTALIAGTLGRPRLLSFLLTIFAATGLGLGLVGVYGVVAYRVRQREREIGVRLALGAAPATMAKSVVAQGVWHALAGIAIGLPAALLLSRVLGSVVFGVTTHDPWTFTLLPALVVAVTTVACYLPARRAARIDPVVALRQD